MCNTYLAAYTLIYTHEYNRPRVIEYIAPKKEQVLGVNKIQMCNTQQGITFPTESARVGTAHMASRKSDESVTLCVLLTITTSLDPILTSDTWHEYVRGVC
jgi:hypothetical protein